MTGMTACVNRNVPVRLKWISDCQSASVSSSVVAAGLAMIVLPPTALTRMSILPKRLAASATTLSTWRLVERIGVVGMGLAAGCRDLGDGRVQPLAIVVDGGDASALARR